jgi:hypothetical protein
VVASVTFNGLSLDVAPYHIEVVEGLIGSPDIRSADRPRTTNGLVPGVDRYSGRAVTMTVNIVADTPTAISEAVSAFATAFSAPKDVDSPLTFTIPGVASGLAARLNVRPRKMSVPIDRTYHQGAAVASVELFAADPLIYSDTTGLVTLLSDWDVGGLLFDLEFDAIFGGGGSFGTSTINNAGSAVAPVFITINGPVTNPEIRNVTTGQSLGFTVTLDVGELLEIDSAARTVMLGGSADRYSYLTLPQWWGLVPGRNEIRYFADAAVASIATVRYRSAWI